MIDSIQFISSFIAIALNIFLGSVVLLHTGRQTVNLLFFVITLSVALWAMFIYMSWSPFFAHQIDFWSNMTFVGPALLAAVLYQFSGIFPSKKKLKTDYLEVVGYLGAFIVAFLAVAGKINAETINPWTIERGWGIHVFTVYFGTFMGLSLYNLVRTLLSAKDKNTKDQVRVFFLGIFISMIAGTFFNLVLPLVFDNAKLTYFGPVFTGTFFTSSIAFAIFRYQLFNIKIIATELLVATLWIFLLFRTVITNQTSDFFINLTLLVFTLIAGILLIRSVLKEVQAREHIEDLARDLRIANEKLEKVSALKSEFVSVATHQLRGPLTAIKGYSSMILDGSYGEIPEDLKLPAERIHTSTVSLAQVVQDFLDVSRIEQGSINYEMVAFNFKDLVSEVLNELKPNIEASGLDFSFFVEQVSPNSEYELEKGAYVIRGDRLKLKQVIGNMVDNALKYTEKGFLQINLFTSDGKVRLEIIDSGIGISEKTLSSMFQKFERADDADEVNVIGTGLGLYIAKQIAEAHGGQIWAESEGLGKGSKFIFELQK